jgi:hypothetical protein
LDVRQCRGLGVKYVHSSGERRKLTRIWAGFLNLGKFEINWSRRYNNGPVVDVLRSLPSGKNTGWQEALQ